VLTVNLLLGRAVITTSLASSTGKECSAGITHLWRTGKQRTGDRNLRVRTFTFQKHGGWKL
jgi:hypothetical protein